MTQLKAFFITDADLERWTGQKRKVLNMLRHGRPVARRALQLQTGAVQLASRVSELRKGGFDIVCLRDDNTTWYQLLGYTGEDMTDKVHQCPNCGHKF